MAAIYCLYNRKSAFGVGGLASQEPCADSWRLLFCYSAGFSSLTAVASGPNCTQSATTLK